VSSVIDRVRDLSVLRNVQTDAGCDIAACSVRTAIISPGVNLPGREVKLLSPSSPEFQNKRSYTSTPPIRLRDVDRDNITFSP